MLLLFSFPVNGACKLMEPSLMLQTSNKNVLIFSLVSVPLMLVFSKVNSKSSKEWLLSMPSLLDFGEVFSLVSSLNTTPVMPFSQQETSQKLAKPVLPPISFMDWLLAICQSSYPPLFWLASPMFLKLNLVCLELDFQLLECFPPFQ